MRNFLVPLLLAALCLATADSAAAPAKNLLETTTPDVAADQPPQCAASGNQSGITLAFGGGVYLAAWRDEQFDPLSGIGLQSIYAARLDTEGVPLDSPPILLEQTPGTIVQHPTVSFDGTRFVLAWHSQSNGRI